ncbi:MAG: hypothetical protein Q7S09_00850 [bacterium]|nr:hypothetical protein [bacterium]
MKKLYWHFSFFGIAALIFGGIATAETWKSTYLAVTMIGTGTLLFIAVCYKDDPGYHKMLAVYDEKGIFLGFENGPVWLGLSHRRRVVPIVTGAFLSSGFKYVTENPRITQFRYNVKVVPKDLSEKTARLLEARFGVDFPEALMERHIEQCLFELNSDFTKEEYQRFRKPHVEAEELAFQNFMQGRLDPILAEVGLRIADARFSISF